MNSLRAASNRLWNSSKLQKKQQDMRQKVDHDVFTSRKGVGSSASNSDLVVYEKQPKEVSH